MSKLGIPTVCDVTYNSYFNGGCYSTDWARIHGGKQKQGFNRFPETICFSEVKTMGARIKFQNICGFKTISSSPRDCTERGFVSFVTLDEYDDSDLVSKVSEGCEWVEYEIEECYPQFAAENEDMLEEAFQCGNYRYTGRSYAYDDNDNNDYISKFKLGRSLEIEICGKRYVREVVSRNIRLLRKDDGFLNRIAQKGDVVWIEVSPLRFVFYKNNALKPVSSHAIIGGMQFLDSKPNGYPVKWNGDISTSRIGMFLSEHLENDIFNQKIESEQTDEQGSDGCVNGIEEEENEERTK